MKMMNEMLLLLVWVSFDALLKSRNPKLKELRVICFFINAVRCQRAWVCVALSFSVQGLFYFRGDTGYLDPKESVTEFNHAV